MESRIEILTGADRVRKRPGIFFGATGAEGAKNAVKMLLDIFAAEAQLGNCSHIRLWQFGERLELQANDRGLYLGNGEDGVWQRLFCELPVMPRDGVWKYAHGVLFGEDEPKETLYLPAISGFLELSAVQLASAYMDVVVVRDGFEKELHFYRGANEGGLHSQPYDGKNGTQIIFAPDSQVFGDNLLPAYVLKQLLQRYAMLCPGLICSFIDDRGEQTDYCYEGGMAQYVEERTRGPVFTERLAASGAERYNKPLYDACVEVAMGILPRKAGWKCYHNFRKLTYGGTHLAALQRQLCDTLNRCFQQHLQGAAPICWNELEGRLLLIVTSWCPSYATVWENGTRLSVCNEVLTDMTWDIGDEPLNSFVFRHKASLEPLIADILKNRSL